MTVTYFQLIKLALTDAANQGGESFSLSWLRQRIRVHARKLKKRLGPRLNKSIEYVLRNEAQLGYLELRFGLKNSVSSIYLLPGGRHEYTVPVTATIEAQIPSTANTLDELRQENDDLRSKLVTMETRLCRANSLIDINSDHPEVVTGCPNGIMGRLQRLIALSKERKHQIALMHEAEQWRHNMGLLNEYYERDIREREERAALLQEYRAWYLEDNNVEHNSN